MVNFGGWKTTWQAKISYQIPTALRQKNYFRMGILFEKYAPKPRPGRAQAGVSESKSGAPPMRTHPIGPVKALSLP